MLYTFKPELTTNCLQRPLFWGSFSSVSSLTVPLNNDPLPTTATILGTRGWSLYSGLIVDRNRGTERDEKNIDREKREREGEYV